MKVATSCLFRFNSISRWSKHFWNRWKAILQSSVPVRNGFGSRCIGYRLALGAWMHCNDGTTSNLTPYLQAIFTHSVKFHSISILLWSSFSVSRTYFQFWRSSPPPIQKKLRPSSFMSSSLSQGMRLRSRASLSRDGNNSTKKNASRSSRRGNALVSLKNWFGSDLITMDNWKEFRWTDDRRRRCIRESKWCRQKWWPYITNKCIRSGFRFHLLIPLFSFYFSEMFQIELATFKPI